MRDWYVMVTTRGGAFRTFAVRARDEHEAMEFARGRDPHAVITVEPLRPARCSPLDAGPL